jgi:hypothetical protein
MTDEAKPVVIVLGDFAHEGLTAKIESLGFTVVNKRFRSSPRNWTRIADLIRDLNNEDRLAVVFGYLPTPTVLLVADEEYDDVRPAVISELERAHTLLFVYEDNLQGIVEPLPWEVNDVSDRDLAREDLPWRTLYSPPWSTSREDWLESHADVIDRAMGMLSQWGQASFEVLPFRKRSDVTIRMFEALEDAQAGVFLRLYVPNGRYQSEQLEDFLALFSRYLRDVERKEFSIDVERTNRGTTYVFKGRDEASTLGDLRAATGRFDRFLVLAESDGAAAERALIAAGTSGPDAAFVVAKYARSFRRLRLEMKHEFERRTLLLSQEMEVELIDAEHPSPVSMPSESQPSSLLNVVGNTGSLTVNVATGGSTQNARVSIEKVVSGGIDYTSEDRAILGLIAELRDELQALELRSTLDRLKDPGTSPEAKRTGAQRLKAFLYSSARHAGKKADEVGTAVLIKYLTGLAVGAAQ